MLNLTKVKFLYKKLQDNEGNRFKLKKKDQVA